MDGDTYNPEYYQYLLTSLTLNSRALITELTAAAEKFSDHAEEIVGFVEERIRKCLPKHKLYAIYLLDSICKNIGNPYNLLFGYRLYKIFTESYLVVTDTPTRQSLIDLFKTWAKAKTSAGVDLFPPDVVAKIEGFIIKATALSQQQAQQASLMSSSSSSSSAAPDAHAGPHNSYLTKDMLLREGNCLLQYIIALNTELDRYPFTDRMREFQHTHDPIRNDIISRINYISEAIIGAGRAAFEAHVQKFHGELLSFRKVLDEQVVVQREFLKEERRRRSEGPSPAATSDAAAAPSAAGGGASGGPGGAQDAAANSATAAQSATPSINYTPTAKFFSNWTLALADDEELLDLVKAWGKPVKHARDAPLAVVVDDRQSLSPPASLSPVPSSSTDAAPPTSAASALGMSFTSLNFMDSMLSSTISSSEPYISPEEDRGEPSAGDTPEVESPDYDPASDGDADTNDDERQGLYDPEAMTNRSLLRAIPKFSGVMPPSNLKKRTGGAADGERQPKRVRFADDLE